jgi:hypothetical protein
MRTRGGRAKLRWNIPSDCERVLNAAQPLGEEENVMRYASIGRAGVVGLALLFLLWVCPDGFAAEEEIVIKVTALEGTANVTKADGTTETLKDTSKVIALPATIEMMGPKGSFSISLPTSLTGKFNALSWTQRQGETLRISLLEHKKGVKLEYLKGERKLYVDVVNRENLLAVASVQGTTSLMLLQNRINIPEKSSVTITTPVNVFASVTLLPGQVSEIQFAYSAIEVPFVEGLAVPVPEPETVEQSPFRP